MRKENHKLRKSHKLLRNLMAGNLKSQAALEFLTTYGWAFLVILIMMSALAYFGVLSPSKLLPDRCNFGSEISCNKDLMVVTRSILNTLTMRVKNDVGAPVTITDVKVTTDVTLITGCDRVTVQGSSDVEETTIKTTAPGGVGEDYIWGSGDTITMRASCAGGGNLVPNEKIKLGIEIDYYPSAASSIYTKTVFGEVFTTIQ